MLLMIEKQHRNSAGSEDVHQSAIFPLQTGADSPRRCDAIHIEPTQKRVSLRVSKFLHSRSSRLFTMPLTDVQIRNAKPRETPYKLTDGKGLYLEVRPTGAKLWRYRYRIGGKENVFAIGQYGAGADAVALADARSVRDEARRLVKQGIHPAHDRSARKAENVAAAGDTFKAMAEEWVKANKPRWSPYYLKQVERGLQEDIYPKIGNLPLRAVNSAHALDIVKTAEKRGAECVALMLRQWSGAVFRYAIAHLRADTDPFEAVKRAVVRPTVKHHAPLALSEVPAFLKALGGYGGRPETVIALRLLLLLFVRPGELRAARWEEFDMDAGMWTIPAARMKMRKPHKVPLPTQAVSLLRRLRALNGDREHLFPNIRNPRSCMTATTLNRALEYMGYAGRFSSHGFRATASTALNEMGVRSDVIEAQLAHQERNKSRASYNRSEYLSERADVLQRWADMIDGIAAGGKVIPIDVRRNRAAPRTGRKVAA